MALPQAPAHVQEEYQKDHDKDLRERARSGKGEEEAKIGKFAI